MKNIHYVQFGIVPITQEKVIESVSKGKLFFSARNLPDGSFVAASLKELRLESTFPTHNKNQLVFLKTN